MTIPVTYTCYPSLSSQSNAFLLPPAGLMLTASIICTADSACQINLMQ